MKAYNKSLIVIFSIIIVSLTSSCTKEKKPFEPGYQPKISPPDLYKTNQEKTFTGTIKMVNEQTNTAALNNDLDNKAQALVSIIIQTDAPVTSYIAQLGPQWYLQAKKLPLKKGAKVTVIASSLNQLDEDPDEDENDGGVLLVRTIQVGQQKLKLRNEKGFPLWYKQGRMRGMNKNWKTMFKKHRNQRMQQMYQQENGQQATPNTFPPTQAKEPVK